MAQEEPRLVPVPLHRTFADAAHRRDLNEIKAAEELQFDQFGQLRVGRGKSVESFGQRPKIFDLRNLLRLSARRRQMKSAAALDGTALADVVDDQAPHRARSIGEKALAIGKRQLTLAQIEI